MGMERDGPFCWYRVAARYHQNERNLENKMGTDSSERCVVDEELT